MSESSTSGGYSSVTRWSLGKLSNSIRTDPTGLV